jgi:Protein of unknown function (DUF2950)
MTTTDPRSPLVAPALFLVLAWSLAGCRGDESPRTFKTPEQAIEALEAAISTEGSDDLEALFGPGSLEHLQSGDTVADRQEAAYVVELIGQRVTFEDVDETTKIASFGTDPWPFPFPLVSDGGRWRFDLEAGVEELHNRRIGRNELSTLASLHAYVDAQREYRAARPEGDPPRFAQKFRSDEGTRNGLYWPTAEGEEPSPLGDLLADAASEGYLISGDAAPAAPADGDGEPAAAADDGPAAYHGYRYRILTGQGANATGGEGSYLDDQGLMTRGHAAIAWPVSYGNSGIMTFLIGRFGIAFQKDLGPDTEAVAQAITVYDPDETWTPTGD